MYKYKILYSLFEINGERKLGLAWDWCQQALTGPELEEFLANYETVNAYDNDAINQGYLILEPLYETISSESGDQVTIQIGFIVTRNIDQMPINPLSYKWVNRFKNSPDVIEFHDEEPLPLN